MFNPRFNYHNTQSLIVPNHGWGKDTLKDLYSIYAGYQSWKDAKDQAAAYDEARKEQQDNLDMARIDYLRAAGLLPEEYDSLENMENLRELEDMDDAEMMAAAAELDAEELERQRLIDEQERQYQEWLKQQQYANYSNMTSKY